MTHSAIRILSGLCLGFVLSACSSTRLLQEDQYRLVGNTISYNGPTPESDVVGTMVSYLRQQPNASLVRGWNPRVNLYNLAGRGNSFLSRAIRVLGEAPVVYDSTLVDVSIRNLEKHLEYVGYFDSHVTAETLTSKRLARVHYHIDLGRRYPIHSLTTQLPDNADFRAAFLADSLNILIHPGDWLSESLVEQESSRSAKYFRDRGYYGFSKNYYSFEADTVRVPGEACLKMIIREFTRNESPDQARPLQPYTIRDVSISYPSSLRFNERILLGTNGIVPGDIYSEQAVDNTYSRLAAMKVFSGVQLQVQPLDSARLDCKIDLTPARLQGFKVNMEASTNSSGLIGLSPQLSYYHRNLFHGGEWLNMSFLGNFQFKPGNDVSAKEFGTSASISLPRFLGVPLAHFRGPTVPRTEFSLSYNFQDRPEYMRNAISTTFGYIGNWQGKVFYQIYPLKLNIIRVYHIDSEFAKTLQGNPYLSNAYLDHFDLGAGGTFLYTTNSDVNPKTSYHYLRLNLDNAGNLLYLMNPLLPQSTSGSHEIWNTPYSQYLRLEATLGRTWTFGKRDNQALATRLLAGIGLAYGNSETLPFEKQFYGGGASSLRGWQARSVGPGSSPLYDVFTIPSQTGDMKLEANVEYRFKLFWLLSGALFLDAGNVWDYAKTGFATTMEQDDNLFSFKNLPSSIALNTGVGVRIDVSIVLLRLDMGLQLHDPARDGNKWLHPGDWFGRGRGYAIHFGVGYPF